MPFIVRKRKPIEIQPFWPKFDPEDPVGWKKAARERRERERERRQRLDLPPSYEEAQRLFLREARQTEWVFEPLPAPIPPIRRSSKKIIVVTAN